jgi:cytochrome bd-type quinol oxidase subunit 2
MQKTMNIKNGIWLTGLLLLLSCIGLFLAGLISDAFGFSQNPTANEFWWNVLISLSVIICGFQALIAVKLNSNLPLKLIFISTSLIHVSLVFGAHLTLFDYFI